MGGLWAFAFVYMIVPEGLEDGKALLTEYGISGYLSQYYTLILNSIVLMAYAVFLLMRSHNATLKPIENVEVVIQKRYLYYVYAAYFLFIAMMIPIVLGVIRGGRFNDAGAIISGFLAQVIRGMGLLLPPFIYFYYAKVKKTAWKALVVCSPLFLLCFLSGTRMFLLFSIISFAGIWLIENKIDIKKVGLISLLAFSLASASVFIREFRRFGFGSTEEIEQADHGNSLGSNEGLLAYNSMLVHYFSAHDHSYGKESAFILYFWVPRELWPDKPNMLEAWLWRSYAVGISSEGHSSSHAFWGYSYADFGIWGSVIFSLLIASGLSLIDHNVIYQNYQGKFGITLIACMYSIVLIFYRSPLTTVFYFISILIIYNLVKKYVYFNPVEEGDNDRKAEI